MGASTSKGIPVCIDGSAYAEFKTAIGLISCSVAEILLCEL